MKYNSLQLILLYQMLHKLRTYIFLILENILSCRRAYSHFNFDDLISLSMAYLMRWSRRLKDSLFHGSLQVLLLRWVIENVLSASSVALLWDVIVVYRERRRLLDRRRPSHLASCSKFAAPTFFNLLPPYVDSYKLNATLTVEYISFMNDKVI